MAPPLRALLRQALLGSIDRRPSRSTAPGSDAFNDRQSSKERVRTSTSAAVPVLCRTSYASRCGGVLAAVSGTTATRS